MGISVLIKLSSTGSNTFNLYSDIDGFVSPFETNLSRTSLLTGYISNLVPFGTTKIRVMSSDNGSCDGSYSDFLIYNMPDTPTDPSPTPTRTITPTPTITPTLTPTTGLVPSPSPTLTPSSTPGCGFGLSIVGVVDIIVITPIPTETPTPTPEPTPTPTEINCTISIQVTGEIEIR